MWYFLNFSPCIVQVAVNQASNTVKLIHQHIKQPNTYHKVSPFCIFTFQYDYSLPTSLIDEINFNLKNHNKQLFLDTWITETQPLNSAIHPLDAFVI